MALSRRYNFRSHCQEAQRQAQVHLQRSVQLLNDNLTEWGWQTAPEGHTFSIFSQKDERAKAKYHLRQSWRNTLLHKWLALNRRDADIGRQINLRDQIDDSLVDRLRSTFKACNDVRAHAVMMGGMHTAASTRWAGNDEEITEAGALVCPDCAQAFHPTVEHVLWHFPSYDSLRRLSAPACPLVRRLGWGPNVTIKDSLALLAQMGQTRAAEAANRMSRARAQNTIRSLRGGGLVHPWPAEVSCVTKVAVSKAEADGSCSGTCSGAAVPARAAAAVAAGDGSLWHLSDFAFGPERADTSIGCQENKSALGRPRQICEKWGTSKGLKEKSGHRRSHRFSTV